jgi:hypothetical protein
MAPDPPAPGLRVEAPGLGRCDSRDLWPRRAEGITVRSTEAECSDYARHSMSPIGPSKLVRLTDSTAGTGTSEDAMWGAAGRGGGTLNPFMPRARSKMAKLGSATREVAFGRGELAPLSGCPTTARHLHDTPELPPALRRGLRPDATASLSDAFFRSLALSRRLRRRNAWGDLDQLVVGDVAQRVLERHHAAAAPAGCCRPSRRPACS